MGHSKFAKIISKYLQRLIKYSLKLFKAVNLNQYIAQREQAMCMWRQRSEWCNYKPKNTRDGQQITRNWKREMELIEPHNPQKEPAPQMGLTSGLWIVTLRLDTLANCNFLKHNQIFMASLHEISIYWPDFAEQQICVKLMNNKGPCHEHGCQYLWETTASSPGPTRNRTSTAIHRRGPGSPWAGGQHQGLVALPSPPSLKEKNPVFFLWTVILLKPNSKQSLVIVSVYIGTYNQFMWYSQEPVGIPRNSRPSMFVVQDETHPFFPWSEKYFQTVFLFIKLFLQ